MSIEDQVRIRVADALRSAGVNEGRVAVEVLYMMPREFVRAYEELWFEIHGTESVASGSGGGDGRSLGLDERKVKEHEAKIRREGGKEADNRTHGNIGGGLSTRSGYGVGGGAKKKYKKNPDGMRIGMDGKGRSERALEVKRLVDKKLVRLVGGVGRQVDELMERSQGGTPGWVRVLENGREACRNCGKLIARDWVRCPYCND